MNAVSTVYESHKRMRAREKKRRAERNEPDSGDEMTSDASSGDGR